MKTIEVDLRLTGSVRFEVPDDFDTDFVDETDDEILNRVHDYIDWRDLCNQCEVELEDAREHVETSP